MFFTFQSSRFIGLNVIRLFSLIGLCLVFASNIIVLVDDVNAVRRNKPSAEQGTEQPENKVACDYINGSTVPNQPGGDIWAVVNRLFILIQVILCAFSEFGWPDRLFEKILPILSSEFGVGPIGLLEILLSVQVLSHHVDTFAMVAAFFLLSIGFLNLICALFFGKAVKSHRSLTWWRQKDTLPRTASDLAHMAGVPRPIVSVASSVASSIFDEKEKYESPSNDGTIGYGYGFGRQTEKASGLKSFLMSKPIQVPAETLPRYAPRTNSESGSRPNSTHSSPRRQPSRF